jgi:CheY-like chemotaxis protein
VVVEADPGLLRQVVVNLVANASDAGGSRVEVATRILSRDQAPWWQLEVSDDGAGIEPRTLARIFDPFFSTKQDRHGLGLSAVHGIVRRFGGDIEVDSIENVGTTVRVLVPIYRGASPEANASRAAPAAGIARRRVLVIDDEAQICHAIERELADVHDVVVATTGDEALVLLASRRFDLILCDVMMPGMDGHELYRRIAAEYPGLERRFVFMTGALAPNVAQALDGLPNPWLAKPFEIDDVLALIAASSEAA